jgi:hypothetical protein
MANWNRVLVKSAGKYVPTLITMITHSFFLFVGYAADTTENTMPD